MSEFPLPDGIVGSEHLGVRVFCVAAPDPQQLADQIALVLGEHLAADDEIHITYNALQTGWQHDPGRTGWAETLVAMCECTHSSSCEPQLPRTSDET